MARPHKEGLDYFSFDVDFYENKKIRRIMRACGPGSATILTCLLCNIYQNKGYYILWDEDLPFDIADKIGMSEGAVSETINKALQVNFFDQYQYQHNKILTSEEIQNRYKSATTKRHEVVLEESFLVTAERKRVNDANNSINVGDNEHSKVKDSKVKDSKEVRAKALVVADAPTGPKKKDYENLIEQIQGKDKSLVVSGLKDFLSKKPTFLQPYVDYWNVAVEGTNIPKVEAISDSREKQLKIRIKEDSFDFIEIIRKIRLSQKLKAESSWFSFDWVFKNDKNYLKIIEGNYE